MNFGCDRIQCINLVERKDKRELVEKLGVELGIKIDFFPAVKDEKCGARGCFMSHVQILADAYRDGVERVLIFEDDVEISGGVNKTDVKRICRFLDRNKTWEIFNLGGTPDVWEYTLDAVKGYPGIYKGRFMATHALIVNRRGMKRYKDMVYGEPYKSIDIGAYRECEHAYTIAPHIFYQSLIQNDIGNNYRFVIKIHRMFHSFLLWYGLNVNVKVKYIALIAILITVLYFARRFHCNKKTLDSVHMPTPDITVLDPTNDDVSVNIRNAFDSAIQTINQTL